MILVDTSVWIDHLRSKDADLAQCLRAGQVLAHPFVTGELALGNLNDREGVLGALMDLPQAQVAVDDEVQRLIGQERLFGTGIGYVDAHLLAAVRLTPGTLLWTRDKRLFSASVALGLNARAVH